MQLKKGYKTLSVTQLANIIVYASKDANAFNRIRVLFAWMYFQARQEATERTLKKNGYRIKRWSGLKREEIRKLVGGRGSILGALSALREHGLISIENKKITVCEELKPGASSLLTLLCGEKVSGGFKRSPLRPVPVMRAWFKEWARPTRAHYKTILHLVYVASAVSFKNRREGVMKNSGRFLFKDLLALFPKKERTLERARAALIKEKRVSEDKTYRRWVIVRYGHYFCVNLDWGSSEGVDGHGTSSISGPNTSTSGQSNKLAEDEVSANSQEKCTAVSGPYRDIKHTTYVGDQKTANADKGLFKELDLKNPQDIDRTYQLLVEKKKLPNNTLMRLYVHAAAIKVLSEKNVINPTALFYWTVLRKEWGRLKESYEEQAKRNIAGLPELLHNLQTENYRFVSIDGDTQSRIEVAALVAQSLERAA